MSLMVMQSRKCFRLNDGYFDKKSSNHHLEDSMSKYSSKSINSYGNCNDSSYGKHRRNCSPTNGSNSRSRSGSPDNWSPNRSVYANKSSYSRNKDRDRDRDRERDKYYDSKKKGMNCHSSRSRSPIESKQNYNKSVNNHSSHDMNNDIRSGTNRNHNSKTCGIDWTEQMSSTGKKYYYNRKTQVSQWEKPKEWLEIERRHLTKSDRHSSHSFRDNSRDKSCVTSSNSKQYIHTNELSSGHRDKDNSRSKLSGSASTGSNSNSSIRSHSRREDDLRPTIDRSNSDSKRQNESRNSMNCVKRVSESLKSPNVASIESSNTNSNNKTIFLNNNQTNDVIRTQNQGMTSNTINTNNTNNNNYNNNNNNNSSGSAQQLLNQILSQQLSPTQTQALQKILVSSTQGSVSNELSLNFPEETLRALQQALQSLSKASDPKSHTSQSSRHRVSSSPRNASVVGASSESPVSTSGPLGHHHRHHHLHHNQHHYHSQQTHHQSADGIRQELDLLISRAHINKSPISEKSGISSTRHDSPPTSVTNISSAISSASLKPSVPTLTPSLANYFREDLVSHVTGWQADHAEKQANHYSNQSHEIGSHQCTRVSAELKMARSLVRLTEIQSTLQEQRILFATQQIKNVEEWKGQNASHSSYHS